MATPVNDQRLILRHAYSFWLVDLFYNTELDTYVVAEYTLTSFTHYKSHKDMTQAYPVTFDMDKFHTPSKVWGPVASATNPRKPNEFSCEFYEMFSMSDYMKAVDVWKNRVSALESPAPVSTKFPRVTINVHDDHTGPAEPFVNEPREVKPLNVTNTFMAEAFKL